MGQRRSLEVIGVLIALIACLAGWLALPQIQRLIAGTPTSMPSVVIIQSTLQPTLAPLPTYTPYPTYTLIATNVPVITHPTITPIIPSNTPIPYSTPTNTPDTRPGTVLAVGDEWRQNGVSLRLIKYYLWPESGYRNIGLQFYFSNDTGSDMILSVSKSDILITTKAGRSLTSYGYEQCIGNNGTVVPAGGVLDFAKQCGDIGSYFWISTDLSQSDLTELNIRVFKFTSKITDARWQFTLQR